MSDSPHISSTDALNGWKEIAGWLGRSPRTVQRWERDLGLPVRRIPTPDGGAIVYALRAEVEAWRATRATRDIETPADDFIDADAIAGDLTPVQTVSESGPPSDSREATRLTAWPLRILRYRVSSAAVLVAAGLGGLAGAVGTGFRPGVIGVPMTVEFEGRSLRAYSEGGRPLWTHRFDREVNRPATLQRRLPAADITGDSIPELLVPVRFAAQQASSNESDAVLAFRADGSLLWFVQPSSTFRWGSESFSGPWHVRDIVVGRTRSGTRTWIAYSHNTWWPGFVVEVAEDGATLLRYVQPGRVFSLAYWSTAEGPLLVVGGVLNAASSAAVAILDLSREPATWRSPEAREDSCSGCPSGLVSAMYLLPTSHLTRALGRPYGWVVSFKVLGDRVQAGVNDGFGGGMGIVTGSLLTISADGNVVGLQRSDQYWLVHRELEAQGRLTHAAEACPDLESGLGVRRWRPASGWSVQQVPMHSTFQRAAS